MTKADLEARRRVGVRLLKSGMTMREVADAVGASPAAVCAWMAAYRNGGPKALKAKPDIKPRDSRLGTAERAELERALREGARAFGFPNDLWTGPRVQKVLEKKFGVAFHVTHVLRVLRSMGWSQQRPQMEMREQNPEAVWKWRRKAWPAIKKKRAQKAARSSSWTKAGS